MCDVCLVAMPYEGIDFQSIGISTLAAGLKRAEISVKVVHPKFWFAEKIGLDRYVAMLKICSFDEILPEWTFAGAAFPEFTPDHEKFLDQALSARPNMSDFYPELLGRDADLRKILWEIREAANDFVEEAAQRILKLNPKIVGCSSTYQQNCASLALLKKIKEKKNDVVTIMGGPNCDGAMGMAIKRSFNWVDFVVSGEADILLPELCKIALKKGADISVNELPQGAFSEKNCAKTNKPFIAKVNDMDSVPMPDYDDYFNELDNFRFKDDVFPALIMETSRGCWWGEKKSCVFCGLKGETYHYRSKSPKRAVNELDFMNKRHSISNFRMCDNILDMNYFRTVLPELISRNPSPYKIFYEIKPLINEEQIKTLADAGVRMAQPGIESLNDNALELLENGNSAIGNIALLKLAMENGIIVIWNFLVGIPSENHEWYKKTAAWLPMVFHLQAPGWRGLYNMRFHRFSRYYNNQKSFGLNLSPKKAYSYVYPVDNDEMMDLAYYFNDNKYTKETQFSGAGVRELNAVVKEWQDMLKLYADKNKRVQLTVFDDGEKMEIIDTRPCAIEEMVVLTGLPRLIYERCHKPRRKEGLPDYFKNEAKIDANVDDINIAVDELVERKLMLSLSGKLLSLALKEPVRPLMSKREFLVGCKVGKQLYI